LDTVSSVFLKDVMIYDSVGPHFMFAKRTQMDYIMF